MFTLKHLIEEELFITCPLMSVYNFIRFCKDRGIIIDKDDLELYEEKKLFYPVARVEFPKYLEKIEYSSDRSSCRELGILGEGEEWNGETEERYGQFWWAKNIAEEFFSEGLLWSPKERPFTQWTTFIDKDLEEIKIESYYSMFQIYQLYNLLQSTTIEISSVWWSTFNSEEVNKRIRVVIDNFESYRSGLINDVGFDELISFLCQIISNRYYPKTQTDRRTIRLLHTDPYWNWRSYCRKWNATAVLSKLELDIDNINRLHTRISHVTRSLDPLEDWHDLVQFVSVDKKLRLKGQALLAQTFYAMDSMLRLFYKDLANQELPADVGSEIKWKERKYGKGVPDDNLSFLEYLTNEFHLNPRSKLILIVEGKSELEQFPRIAEAVRASFDILGIRIESLDGIGNFKSDKIDKFIDHYHHLQSIVYLILDNDENAKAFRNKLLRRKSLYKEANRFITTEKYVFLWEKCFEFDNFSDNEIANALTVLYKGYNFTASELAECRTNFSKQGNPIDALVKKKTRLSLNKPILAERLVDGLIQNITQEFTKTGKPKRAILEKVIEICDLARRNFQPSSYEAWKKNQESGYFGAKIDKSRS